MIKTAVRVLSGLIEEYTTPPSELARKRAIALEEELAFVFRGTDVEVSRLEQGARQRVEAFRSSAEGRRTLLIYLGVEGDSWVFQGDGFQTLRGSLSEYDVQQVYRDMFEPLTPVVSEEAASVVQEKDDEDEGPDCTGKIHRRFCRKFNREIANDLYWMPWDEVKTPGSYLKHPRHQFGVTSTITVGPYEGKMVEFTGPARVRPLDVAHCYLPLDVHHIYLGPLPAIPDSFLDE